MSGARPPCWTHAGQSQHTALCGLLSACPAPEQSRAPTPHPWAHPEQRGCRHSTCQVPQTRGGLGKLAVAEGDSPHAPAGNWE